MTARSTQHSTFVIERTLAAPPPKVFAAWATQEAKDRWFGGPDDCKVTIREFDFRVGGREREQGTWPDGKVSDFAALYQDIVPNERIVYIYDMHLNGQRISISLATVEFKRAGAGTKLIVTEQGVFLDGYDDAGSREHGTGWLMDKLVTTLK